MSLQQLNSYDFSHFRNHFVTIITLKMKKITALFLALFIFSQLLAQNSEISRRNLETISPNLQVNNIEIQEITFPSGQIAPKHLHPCPVMGYIKSGSVYFQIEGQEPIILNEGDYFYEPKNVTILHFDNASRVEPMTFVAFYLKENEEENMQLIN